MTNVVEEVAAENRIEPGAEPLTCCIPVHNLAKQAGKTVHDVQASVSETLAESKKAVERLWTDSRTAINECVGETAQTIKQHPFASVTIALAAGTVLGLIAPRTWGWKKYPRTNPTNCCT